MKNKIIILIDYPSQALKLEKNIRNKLKSNFSSAKQNLKNFSDIIIYKNKFNKKIKINIIKKKKLYDIKKRYYDLGIKLDLIKIYNIDIFLRKIKSESKKEKIFISPYSMFFTEYSDETIIFYELSKLYNMQFVKPERSFIKNRYILAKNIFKHPYVLKKKTVFNKKKLNNFKVNYALAMDNFSKSIKKSNKINISTIDEVLLKVLRSIFNFKLQETPKKFALLILGNSSQLGSNSKYLTLKKFVKDFFYYFNYELVFLVHPSTNILKFLINHIRKNDIFFNNKKVVFLQKPKDLNEIIKKCQFVIHTSSSLTPQTIFFKKKILCLGKNINYINTFNNLIQNFQNDGFNFVNKKIKNQDYLKTDNFLKTILSNSVNYKGEFNLNISNKHYSSSLKITNTREQIVINLLNSI